VIGAPAPIDGSRADVKLLSGPRTAVWQAVEKVAWYMNVSDSLRERIGIGSRTFFTLSTAF
jgi:hypothetical protein